MLECREIVANLGRYLDGELPPQDARVVEAHIHECSGCLGELRALQSLSASLDAFFPPPVPDGMVGDVMLHVTGEANPASRAWAVLQFWKPWPVPMRLTAAGVAAVACVIGLLLSSTAFEPRTGGQGEMAWVELSAGSGIARAYLDTAP